ncbi:MAG: hypothetical protein EP315_03230, partial [Gammaproteobacteria bacterium]
MIRNSTTPSLAGWKPLKHPLPDTDILLSHKTRLNDLQQAPATAISMVNRGFMIENLTPRKLYEHLCHHIDLHWIAGTHHADRDIRRQLRLNQKATLIGHLNLIHPNRIQVIGRTEWHYLEKIRKQSRLETIQEIFSRKTAAVVF